MHHIWRPVPGRFKDYIAMPRPNLYQSLHTTVLHGGQPFEVQIRTQEMHRIAEEGVAAHWKYKGGKPASGDDDQRIAWMRQLIEWSQEMQEPGEFLSTLKVDLGPVEVYAFTPKGRVLELPRGATPVDFAYSVHTEVGHQCVGAKVNGQMVPLRHEIVSGDVVEILTQKGHTPSRDWLSFVKSSHARSKIRQWINLHEREEATEMGKRLLEKESRHFGRGLKKIPEADWNKLLAEYGLSKLEDLYAAVGFGKYSARQVLARVLGEPDKPAESEAEDSKPTLVKTVKRMLGFGEAPLIVKGHDDLLVYRAKCCNPIPGDDIVGYITRGRGVAVHTRACPNVQNLHVPDRAAHRRRVGRRKAPPLSRCNSPSVARTAPACWRKSPRSSAERGPISAVSRAAPTSKMPALKPAWKLWTAASLKPSSSISEKFPASSESNASTRFNFLFAASRRQILPIPPIENHTRSLESSTINLKWLPGASLLYLRPGITQTHFPASRFASRRMEVCGTNECFSVCVSSWR